MVLEQQKEFKKLLVEAEVDISFKSFKMGRIGKKIGGFFKKVWGGIKKGASWVYKKVLTPIGTLAWKGIKTIAKPVSKILVKSAPAIAAAGATAFGAPELAPIAAGATSALTSAISA